MKKLIIAFTIPMLFFACSEDNITGTNEEEENNGNETETIVHYHLRSQHRTVKCSKTYSLQLTFSKKLLCMI